MAVALKNDPDVKAGAPAMGLAGASLLGTVYVVLGFMGVYYLLPWAWETYIAPVLPWRPEGFASQGLLLLAMLAGAAGLVWLWSRLVRQSSQPGLRAGVFVGTVMVLGGLLVLYLVNVFAAALLSRFVSDEWLLANGLMVGSIATALTVGLWTGFVWRTFHKPKFHDQLQVIEDQGWFTPHGYKKGQGLRARRMTMFGIILLVGCGLWAYLSPRQIILGDAWRLGLPFGGELLILHSTTVTVAILVAVLTLWFSYRLVNYPRFADFLIATEAEMNKVSWASRRRIVQDTIVVLTTVVLLTVFLYVTDVVWSTLLKWIGVLQMGG